LIAVVAAGACPLSQGHGFGFDLLDYGATAMSRKSQKSNTPDIKPILIKIEAAVQITGIPKHTLYRLIQARRYDEDIAAGRKTRDDVPRALRSYLGRGFPLPRQITPGMRRLRLDEVEAWTAANSIQHKKTPPTETPIPPDPELLDEVRAQLAEALQALEAVRQILDRGQGGRRHG
jgi:predicted DNA-binding transcriptional regulator AlpA